MADKEIRIDLKATGGDQAAAEVKKLTAAEKEATEAAEKLAQATGSGTTSGAGKGAAAGVKQLADELPEAEKGVKASGQAALEAARFFDDLQYGVKGVVNNVPGLVAAMGGGAGLAGVLGLVAVGLNFILPKLQALGGSVEDETKAAEDLAEALEEVGKKRLKAAEAAGEKEAASRIEEIEAESRALREKTNLQELEINLARERQRLEVEIQSSSAAMELAKIDADTGMSEMQKIEARALVRQQMLKNQSDRNQQEYQDRKDDAARAAKNAEDEVATKQAEIEKLNADAAALKQRRTDLSGQLSRAGDAQASLPGAVAQLKKAREVFEERRGSSAFSPEQVDAAYRAAVESLENLKSTQALSRSAGTKESEALQTTNADLKKLEESAAKKQVELKALQVKAAEKARESGVIGANVDELQSRESDRFFKESERLRLGRDQSKNKETNRIEQERIRADQKAARDAEREEQRKQREEEQRQRLGGKASDVLYRESQVDEVPKALQKQLYQLSKQVDANPTGQAMDQAAALVKEVVELVAKMNADKKEDQRRVKREFDQLRAQIKNLGNGN